MVFVSILNDCNIKLLRKLSDGVKISMMISNNTYLVVHELRFSLRKANALSFERTIGDTDCGALCVTSMPLLTNFTYLVMHSLKTFAYSCREVPASQYCGLLTRKETTSMCSRCGDSSFDDFSCLDEFALIAIADEVVARVVERSVDKLGDR